MFEIIFFHISEKYDIDIPSTIKKNYDMMPKNWLKYCEQLREIDDNLYSQKEQFKMGIVKPTAKPKIQETPESQEDEDKEEMDDIGEDDHEVQQGLEPQEVSERTEDDISSASEL